MGPEKTELTISPHFKMRARFELSRPDCFYLSDFTAIRYYDAKTDTVSVMVGGGSPGGGDGVGCTASFDGICDFLVSGDGKTLWVSDVGNRSIRRVDTNTKAVTTCAPNEDWPLQRDGPYQLVFDRSPLAAPESSLLVAGYLNICRFDIASGEWYTLEVTGHRGVACTSAGVIIYLSCFEQLPAAVHTFDRRTSVIGTLWQQSVENSSRCHFVVNVMQ